MSLINRLFISSQDVVNIGLEWRDFESLLEQPEFTQLSFRLLLSEAINNATP